MNVAGVLWSASPTTATRAQRRLAARGGRRQRQSVLRRARGPRRCGSPAGRSPSGRAVAPTGSGGERERVHGNDGDPGGDECLRGREVLELVDDSRGEAGLRAQVLDERAEPAGGVSRRGRISGSSSRSASRRPRAARADGPPGERRGGVDGEACAPARRRRAPPPPAGDGPPRRRRRRPAGARSPPPSRAAAPRHELGVRPARSRTAAGTNDDSALAKADSRRPGIPPRRSCGHGVGRSSAASTRSTWAAGSRRRVGRNGRWDGRPAPSRPRARARRAAVTRPTGV